MIDKLISSVKEGNTILFVGAGVSMNLGIPSWNQLIEKLSLELGYDPEVYKTFGDNYALAEYYLNEIGSIGPLRSWMDREWHSSRTDISASNIHKLIVNLNFPIIYTTNYDRWIEKAYDFHGVSYTKIVSASDLSKIKTDTTQIVKFHGDFDDDTSIVLGETSYFERLDFETALDIKLRADVLSKSVLFIGYSLADINLRYLFYKLSKIKKNSAGKSKGPESYIYFYRPNPIQESILKNWDINVFSSPPSSTDTPAEALVNFLEKLKLI